jgi:prevent-host-death family protein
MTKVTSTDAKNEFDDVLRRASTENERVVITSNGKSIAAVVPITDLAVLEKLEDMIDTRDALAAIEDYEKNGGTDWDALKKELGYD